MKIKELEEALKLERNKSAGKNKDVLDVKNNDYDGDNNMLYENDDDFEDDNNKSGEKE